MNGPLKIIYVSGWLRSGSTVLGNVLAEVPEFFHAGELHFLWKNAAGLGANRLCGCGLPLTGCPLWTAILPVGRPAGMTATAHARLVLRQQRASVRTRHTWRVLRRGLGDPVTRSHAALMTAVYHAIAEHTGATVIVDSGKMAAEAALLPHLDGVSPYFVHLVRDPRAVAQSYREPKQYVEAMPAVRSTAYWHGFNRAAEAVSRRYPERSAFLRYEEFIADPRAAVAGLLELCGADPAVAPVHGQTVELHPNHTVTGNPDRFRSGLTVIRNDDSAWRSRLPGSARLAARTLSWPLFERYGYHRAGPLPGPPAMRTAGQASRAVTGRGARGSRPG
jgi:hypothetical protein